MEEDVAGADAKRDGNAVLGRAGSSDSNSSRTSVWSLASSLQSSSSLSMEQYQYRHHPKQHQPDDGWEHDLLRSTSTLARRNRDGGYDDDFNGDGSDDDNSTVDSLSYARPSPTFASDNKSSEGFKTNLVITGKLSQESSLSIPLSTARFASTRQSQGCGEENFEFLRSLLQEVGDGDETDTCHTSDVGSTPQCTTTPLRWTVPVSVSPELAPFAGQSAAFITASHSGVSNCDGRGDKNRHARKDALMSCASNSPLAIPARTTSARTTRRTTNEFDEWVSVEGKSAAAVAMHTAVSPKDEIFYQKEVRHLLRGVCRRLGGESVGGHACVMKVCPCRGVRSNVDHTTISTTAEDPLRQCHEEQKRDGSWQHKDEQQQLPAYGDVLDKIGGNVKPGCPAGVAMGLFGAVDEIEVACVTLERKIDTGNILSDTSGSSALSYCGRLEARGEMLEHLKQSSGDVGHVSDTAFGNGKGGSDARARKKPTTKRKRKRSTTGGRRCKEDGCSLHPHFGFTRAEYCSRHKLEGMFNVKGRRCVDPDCARTPVYGKIGDPHPTYCAAHKLVNMVDIKNPTCREPSCARQPSFGCPRDRRAAFCASHMMTGMVNVRRMMSPKRPAAKRVIRMTGATS